MTTSNKIMRDWTTSLEGVIQADTLTRARLTARARGQELEIVLLREFGVPRLDLLNALSAHYGLPSVEYDERLPVPPELLEGLNSDMLSMSLWFPVAKENETVLIAVNDPLSPTVIAEVDAHMKGRPYEFRIALQEDIQWYVQDLLNASVGYLIGTERTGLAFWRNNMAHWRTRLACYRTDMAKARTSLSVLRWGFGVVALSLGFIRVYGSLWFSLYLYWSMMLAGICLGIFGLVNYWGVRKSRMSPPRHQTVVEVTSATTQFLERYHVEDTGGRPPLKETMLSRLGDFMTNYCTIIKPVPASRVRTYLARERNILAAQRTLAACYRTIYARARTGLAFIRTGIVFASLGLGFIKFFSLSLLTVADILLIVAGVLMVFDGVLWYLPARQEKENLVRIRATNTLP